MKALIKLLLGLAGLFVVVVIAVVITVATVDLNDHKDWISEKALEQTGRQLDVDGDIAVSLYPWLGLEVNDVDIGNAKGFAEEQFLHADYLKLRVKLMPMLKDQYEVDTVILRGAKVNLAKNKDGVTNWDDLVKEEKSDDGALPLAAVVLGGVDIENATIVWADQSTDTRYDITNMNVKTDPLRYGEPLKLTVDMDVLANKPALEGHINVSSTIAYDIDNQRYNIKPLTLVADMKGDKVPGGKTQATLSAAIDLDLDKDTATISDLILDALDTQVLANLNASDIQNPAGPTVETSLDVKGRNLALLFKVAEIEPLASHLATLKDQNFTLGSKLSADVERGDIDVSQLSIAMLGATVAGKVKARNSLSDTPEYAGELKASGPDLPTLLQVLGQFQGGKDSTLSQFGNTLAQGKDKKFNIDLSFSADMKSGNAEVPRLALELLGAKVNGEVSAHNMQSKAPGYKGKLNASGPDLPTLLQVLGQAQGDKESSLLDYGKKLSSLSKKAFKINADFDADMESGNIDIPKLDIDSLGISIAGNLKGKNVQADNGSVNGRLSIKGNNLRPLPKALDNKALMDVVKSIDIEAGISGNAGNMNLKPLTLKTTVTSEQTGKQAVDVFLNADTNINLDKQILSMAGLTLKGLGMNLQGSIEAKNFLEAPAIKGEVNVAPFDLRALMTRLGKELPDTADKKVLTKVGLNTIFSASQSDMDITKMALQLDQSKLNGTLSVKNFEKPAIRFGIDIDQINLDRYLAPPAENEKGKPITPETAASAAAQLPVETLQGLNVKGDLSIGQFTVSKARMSNVKLSIDGKDGKIKLAPASANLYQGSYKADVSINANGKLPKLIVNSSIKGVQIEPLLKDVTGEPASLVGISDISIAVVARGQNTDTFKQTLSGQAELKVTNVIVRGVDIPGALEQVEIMIEQKRPGKINTEGDTPFSSLTATLPINAGVVNNNDLLLTAPGFKVTGKGTLARLTDMTWKYKLKAGVDERSVAKNNETYNVGGYKIDINCRGKLDPNNCKPDAFKLAGEAVQKLLLDKILPGQGSSGTTAPADANATSTNTDPKKELLDKALKSIFK
ncbi:MAG: AsmA family protein [Gammaproteobacteria bacterium]|nr:AsmA family protein [Gammaproteobacteria bacterium]